MKKIVVNFRELDECIKYYSCSNNIYFILDAAQISEEVLIFLKKIKYNENIEVYSLFSGTAEGNVPFEVAPLLIYFKEFSNYDNNEEFQYLQKLWKNYQVLNLIFSSLILSEFIRKMKKYLTIEFPDSSKKIFRWFDPRIIKNIEFILEDKQILEFFHDIDFWVAPIRNYSDVELNQVLYWENI